MIAARVTAYLTEKLQCQEIKGTIQRAYRKFKIPQSPEFFFLTDLGLFIGETFKTSRPARATLNEAYNETSKVLS